MTFRDIVGRFLTMLNANIGLCNQVRPNFFYNGSEFLPCAFAVEICRSGSISKNHQLTNLNKFGKFHACIRNSTILALSRLAILAHHCFYPGATLPPCRGLWGTLHTGDDIDCNTCPLLECQELSPTCSP